MPLNTLRLNHQPSSHPNERIVFIKPIPRPPAQKDDYDRAELVLKAIAAQCLPIMKDHHLSVTTLEEYEPNPEFIGRNFNNGEIIQLVIKSKSGAWLPLNMIQMVMMHELAHNNHMNHGKGFWQTRSLYAGEMRGLWSKGYTGEGLWGQGRSLQSVENALGGNIIRSEELADLQLCGGTFRSRRKKRKAKDASDLTWKEKRDKRIEKKFGKNGEKLGENEDARLILELSRKGPIGGKPRVAQSKRGRELRAAAALARFETNKKGVEEQAQSVKGEEETESETEYEEVDAGQEEAKDSWGDNILDSKGQSMVRVCEEENADDVDVKRELQELADLDTIPPASERNSPADCARTNLEFKDAIETTTERSINQDTRDRVNMRDDQERDTATQQRVLNEPHSEIRVHADPVPNIANGNGSKKVATASGPGLAETECSVCSMTNDAMRLCCVACANVLDTRKDSKCWKCKSEICKDSSYVNAGDCGICGVCETRRPAAVSSESRGRRGVAHESGRSAHIAYL